MKNLAFENIPQKIVPLGNHRLADFLSNVPIIERFLRDQALQDEDAKTYILPSSKDPTEIIAFYTLKGYVIYTTNNSSYTRHDTIRISHFAVDSRYRNRHLEENLLAAVLWHCIRLARNDIQFQPDSIVMDVYDSTLEALLLEMGFVLLESLTIIKTTMKRYVIGVKALSAAILEA